MRPETYALTAVTHQRRRIFQVGANAELFLTTLFRYREQNRFRLHGFVIMPDHVHILLTPSETIERAIQLIKGGYSFAVRKQLAGEVWQQGYYAHRITTPEDFLAQLAYIAANPDRRHLRDHPYVHTRIPQHIDEAPDHCKSTAQGLKPQAGVGP